MPTDPPPADPLAPAGHPPLPGGAAISARTHLAVRAGRLAGRLSRLTGNGVGVTIGGRVALALAPASIAELARGRPAVVVSGTNGKTTTTRLIAAALAASGQLVVSNDTGANLASGLVSALGEGDPSARPVLEVDEAVLPRVVDALDPALLVLTNLSRDQLDRYGEVGQVAGRWRSMLAARPNQAVVANMRDPFIVWAAQPAQTLWVDTGLTWREDATVCPACGALLEWRDGWFGSACGFEQPAAAAAFRDGAVEIAGTRIPLTLALPGRWNEANAAMALVAARALGADPALAAGAMAEVGEVGGRQATWRLPDGRAARLLLAKNPAGWSEVLAYLARTGSGVVIALNARIADGKDPSWLWDVPFELLAARGASAVAASGERHLDLAVRLHYAGVDFVDEADPLRAASRVAGERVDVVATYSAFVALLRRLRPPARGGWGASTAALP
jgi:UDP-N-acetylmuramyl tripeptide synthase